jgi:hypothetical protein
MNMTAVTATTNMDKSKIVFAGVDAGVKMFVELARSDRKCPDIHVTCSMEIHYQLHMADQAILPNVPELCEHVYHRRHQDDGKYHKGASVCRPPVQIFGIT